MSKDINLHVGIHLTSDEDIIAYWRLFRNLCHLYGAQLSYATMSVDKQVGLALPREIPPPQEKEKGNATAKS